jgi:hypothetical protein
MTYTNRLLRHAPATTPKFFSLTLKASVKNVGSHASKTYLFRTQDTTASPYHTLLSCAKGLPSSSGDTVRHVSNQVIVSCC